MKFVLRLCVLSALLAASPALAQDNLEILNFAPQGEVENLTHITVQFSENMRALGMMEQDQAGSPLQITAAEGELPPGVFRWLDPATLAYLFDELIHGPLEIQATVKAGTSSLSGNTLPKTQSWTISTPELILEANLNGYQLPPEQASFNLVSNYQLDLDSLREKTSLSDGGATLPITISENANSRWDYGRQTRWYYQVTIEEKLAPDTRLTLKVEKGVKPAAGMPGKAFSFRLASYGKLQLDYWSVGEAGSNNPFKIVRPESQLQLNFNNPVAPEKLSAHLEISPPTEFLPGEEYSHSYTQHSFYPPYRFAADTLYTVTIKAGLEDAFGTVLAEDISFPFGTGDFFPVFDMAEGYQYLERQLASHFPMVIRNISPVNVALDHYPWKNSLTPYFLSHSEAWPPKAAAGRIHRDLSLNYTDRKNENIRELFDLPERLQLTGPRGTPGWIDLHANYTLRGLEDHEEYAGDHMARLQITNLGVTAKIGREKSLVWVTGLDAGDPVADTEVRLLDMEGETLWLGHTNKYGVAETPGEDSFGKPVAVVAAVKNDDSSILPVDHTRLPQPFYSYATDAESGRLWKIHALTQTPLYQPGQEVNFVLYVKAYTSKENGVRLPVPQWLPLAGKKVNIDIVDNRNRTVHTVSGSTNAFGSIAGSFVLSGEAAPGFYSLHGSSPDMQQQAWGSAFQVASFRPPDFKVDLTGPKSQPVPVNTAGRFKVSLAAAYFSGAALPGAGSVLDVLQSDTYFTPPRLDGYRTGLDNPPFGRMYPEAYHDYGAAEADAALGASLDADGKAVYELPPLTAESGHTRLIQFEATVTDASGLTSQGAGRFTLHPSSYYIGMRGPRFVPAGEDAVMEFKAATWDNQPAAGNLQLTVYLVEPDKDDELIWEKNFNLTDPNGQEFKVSFDKSGMYQIEAAIIDPQGRENSTRVGLWVAGAHHGWLQAGPQADLEMFSDLDEYVPGDTAKIAISNPFDKALALIARERDSIIAYEVKEITGSSPSVEIPITEADAPYTFVTVTLIRGRTAPPPALDAPGGTEDAGSPRAAFGMINLAVKADNPPMSVQIATDKDEYRPGGEVSATVRVKSGQNPMPDAQVTLLAVDERILRAAGENTDPYHPGLTFGQLISYLVANSDTRTRLLNLNVPLLRELDQTMTAMAMRSQAEQAPPEPMPAAATGAGGEDGAQLRQQFSPLAFWLAAGQTDAQGALQASFILPDTLTSYRVVAVAADKRQNFASRETSITASKPLQILSAMPRFATLGDQLEAGILVQNLGSQDGVVAVKAEAFNMSIRENSKTIAVPAGQSGLVSFDLAMTDVGLAKLRVTAAMGAETDAAEFALPVKTPAPLTTVAAAGLLCEGGSYALPVLTPAPLDERSQMAVIMAPSPAAGLPLTTTGIINYPWDCLEQRLSKAWAMTMRLRHSDLIGLPPERDDPKRIRAIMDSLGKFQRHDGGLALWPGIRQSDFYLTAYALLVNSQTKLAGYAMDEQTEENARYYIQANLHAYLSDSTSQDAGAMIAPALGIWLLAQSDPRSADVFFEPLLKRALDMQDSSPLIWAFLLMTARDLFDPQDREAIEEKILTQMGKTINITPTHMHFASSRGFAHWMSMGSSLRDNGAVLAALALIRPEYPRLEGLAAWISQGLGEKTYLSTQESVYSLWGLINYLQTLGGNRTVRIEATWDGNATVTESFQRLIEPPRVWLIPAGELKAGQNADLVLRARQGNPFWTARLTYASPAVPMQAENAGFTISRQWLTPGPWKMGDIIDVQVTVTVPASRRHVLLFDPFPAGLEPVHATRIDLQNAEQAWQYPWEWEDIREDGVLLYAGGVEPGVYVYKYQLRAAAPGTFVQRPGYVEEMYSPEVFGRTKDDTVSVTRD